MPTKRKVDYRFSVEWDRSHTAFLPEPDRPQQGRSTATVLDDDKHLTEAIRRSLNRNTRRGPLGFFHGVLEFQFVSTQQVVGGPFRMYESDICTSYYVVGKMTILFRAPVHWTTDGNEIIHREE